MYSNKRKSKKMMITSKVNNVTKQGNIDQQIPINIICIYMCTYIAFFSYQKMILTGEFITRTCNS